MFATATRGHDAEWHLQQEKVTNDRMVATARRHGRKVIAKNVTEIPKVPPPDPDVAAAAVRTCWAIAGRKGMDAAATTEVLVVLGLLDPTPEPVPTPSPAPAKRPRSTGVCTQCGRSVDLRRDGTLAGHPRTKTAPAGAPRCLGTHTHPRPEATR